MRLPTLLVSTAILTAVTASGASAQTTAPNPRTKKDATTTVGATSRSPALRKRVSRSYLPPPPPVPVRPSRRVAAASRASAGTGMIGMEQTGRTDRAGRPVAFYPTVRGKPTAGPRPSASRNAGTNAAPRENPAKNPYKILPSNP